MRPPRRVRLPECAVPAVAGALLLSFGAGAAPGQSPGSPSPSATAPAAGPAPASPKPSAEAPADETPAEAYKRHLDNGVRLWGETNYRAAITEFEAAYAAEPKASPLVNIALCRRALFEYPQAVEALKRALTKHVDSLSPEVREAAEREVRELEALIGYVTVKTNPPGATLFVDGVERGAAGNAGPLALSAGPHDIEARLKDHTPAKAHIEVVAGQHSRELVLELAPAVAQVRVVPKASAAFVEVDRQSPVQAGWEGVLPPGLHVVRIFEPDGPSASVQIAVKAGEHVVVTQREDGTLTSTAAVAPDKPPEPPIEPEPEPRTGFFLHGNAALLLIGGTAPKGMATKSGGGIGLGLRVGYRLADWVGVEVGGQLSSVGGAGELWIDNPALAGYSAERGAAAYPDTRYTLQSLRGGAMVRLFVPGQSVVRFTAALGGGFVAEELSWTIQDTSEASNPDLPDDAADALSRLPVDASGWNGYGQIDLGVELEFSGVFFGLMLQHILQSSRGLTGEDDVGIYQPYEGPVFLIGPALNLGYGFW